jgi:hypothetical protein
MSDKGIGLPQRSPRRSVLRCPHPAGFPRFLPDHRSTLWGAYQRCVSRYAVQDHSRTLPPQRPSVLLAMCPAHCHLGFSIRQAMSVTVVLGGGLCPAVVVSRLRWWWRYMSVIHCRHWTPESYITIGLPISENLHLSTSTFICYRSA